MSKKIKCIRKDGSEVWLNEKVARNRARQRQMGFYPAETVEDIPDTVKGEAPATKPKAPAAEAAPPETEAAEAEPEATESDPGAEAPGGNVPSAAKKNGQTAAMREEYKSIFGKYPPSNWRGETVQSKINA